MKKLFFFLGLMVNATMSFSQGEQNVWVFGTNGGLDFNTMSPVPISTNSHNTGGGCASICDAGGHLLFYSNGLWVWDKNNFLMPALTGGVGACPSPITMSVGWPPIMPYTGGTAAQAAAICNMPSHQGKYYLFSLNTAGQLFYSVIDTALNSGNGDIVHGKKGIFISGGNTEKMTVVRGCNNIWLMVRALSSNQYKAYEINDTGIVTTPIISACGSMPVGWYQYGVIKFTPDGSKMVAACNLLNYSGGYCSGGLELYDFDGKTGKLSNAQIVDSSSVSAYYYGACFSTDNSKLYATTSSYIIGSVFSPESVFQFDISLGSLAAIAASKTLLYTDGTYADGNMSDLKRGIDGKIYMGKGAPYLSMAPYMHCINSPNLAGVSCGFVPNSLAMSSPFGNGLPNDIAILNNPDTIRTIQNRSACFSDSIVVSALDTFGKHYTWQDNTMAKNIVARTGGVYSVGYVNADCKYQVDVFNVNFVHVPVINSNLYSCNRQKQGIGWVKPVSGDTATFTYTWIDEDGSVLQTHTSRFADTIRGLDTGSYLLQIHTAGGCDTSLMIVIQGIPSPQASAYIDSVVCKGNNVAYSAHTDGATWKWYFGDGITSDSLSAKHYYKQAGTYDVQFIAGNIEGCMDTIFKEVQVKSFRLNVSSDKDNVDIGEQITLQTSSGEPYTVTEWIPSNMFPYQQALSQTFKIDTTMSFIISGQSVYGCTDTAMITIAVNPQVFIPTAFSPNGDGLNDRFRPRTAGAGVFIDDFEIYNRWGQMVWYGYGANAAEGWDGKFHGRDAEVGTYFYTVHMVTPSGGTISLKGDVTLIK